MRQYYVYMLASRSRRLYVGMTNDLQRRVFEHRTGSCSFTHKYRIDRLVYFETTQNVMAAIAREKELKGWLRKRKLALVDQFNPSWSDLAAEWFTEPGSGEEKAETADPSLRSG